MSFEIPWIHLFRWRFCSRPSWRRGCVNSLTFCGSVTVIVWKQGLVCECRSGSEPFLARAPPFACCSRLASHDISQMESLLEGFNRHQKVNRLSPKSEEFFLVESRILESEIQVPLTRNSERRVKNTGQSTGHHDRDKWTALEVSPSPNLLTKCSVRSMKIFVVW